MMLKRVLPFLCALLILSGCQNTNKNIGLATQAVEGTEYILGTIVTIKILDHGSDELLAACFNQLKEIEMLMSASVETSDVYKINHTDGPVEVDESVIEVIKKGLYYGDMSGGRFDISLGPVINLWKIGTEEAKVPSTDDLNVALSNVDYKKVQVIDENKVQIAKGMAIDLGGIAKGYAADVVAELLKNSGVESAIINLGGNIKVVGQKAEGIPFRVGIQGPEELRNNYLGVVEAMDKTIVTSGDYERYFIEDGIKYHHIFDSTTGYPYQTEVASVTIVTEQSIVADALSTILFVMPIEEGIAMVEAMEDVECIYVTKDYKMYASSGLKEPVFKLTDDTYERMQ